MAARIRTISLPEVHESYTTSGGMRHGRWRDAPGRLGFVSELAPRELWGGETRKAVANFPVSGEPIPTPVARWLGRIKAAAARVNAELGLLAEEKAERIATAGDRVAAGEFDDQFPIDVFQTGSGFVAYECERSDRAPCRRGRSPER